MSSLRDRVLIWLADNVPAKRVQHILGVEQMAIELATHHRLDVDKAAQAGLMHDLAKYFKPQQLLEIATESGIPIDEVDIAAPHLLHADVSAIVAQREFAVTDTDILHAIADHTLGRPNMSPLSCIVFLADTLEAGRGDTEELRDLRSLSYENLHRAVWYTCDYSLKYLLSTRCLIHPRTIATRNWAMLASRQAVPTPAI
jgi:predicted HD superfamily hydrolase involved in NAD metabolism